VKRFVNSSSCLESVALAASTTSRTGGSVHMQFCIGCSVSGTFKALSMALSCGAFGCSGAFETVRWP